MASLLRQLVAGPRARHAEAGLDLCYVTDNSTYGLSSYRFFAC
ncbi:Phosphatidylinositol-3 4 5-trisphosphate 3-phosphatase PTEN [Pyrenophora tritici-repentis]|nr:Phosphatidylinositol-3 4 5-trisphosphate 3-phosphatase PTEN [Pyrenophora tritici-repentis]